MWPFHRLQDDFFAQLHFVDPCYYETVSYEDSDLLVNINHKAMKRIFGEMVLEFNDASNIPADIIQLLEEEKKFIITVGLSTFSSHYVPLSHFKQYILE